MKKFILAAVILATLVPGFAGSVPSVIVDPCLVAVVSYQNSVSAFNDCYDANWQSPSGDWLTDDQVFGYEDSPCYWENMSVDAARRQVGQWCNFSS
jgi:hypothetical protein